MILKHLGIAESGFLNDVVVCCEQGNPVRCVYRPTLDSLQLWPLANNDNMDMCTGVSLFLCNASSQS